MSPLDPNQVVQQVWQGDYPASWRVFLGEQINGVSNCLMASLIIIAVPLFCIVANGTLSVIFFEATKPGGSPHDGYIAAFFGIVIIAILIALCTFAWKAIKRYRNRQPKPMIVVTPDGVVGYRRRKKVWAIAFADVAHIHLGVDTRGATTTNYASVFWLDLIYRGGQHGECVIEIAPQEMIVQSILEAHTAFRLHHQG